jgi:hypothetical protein
MNAHFFNRRLLFRRAVNEAAWIERVPSILERCMLVNVCEIGARLTISDVYDLPENFALHLTRGSKPGRLCRIIWRREHDIGIEFLVGVPLRGERALNQ